MYAIVRHGGRQLKVAKGDEVVVNRLAGEVGGTVQIDEVLLLAKDDGVEIGRPLVEGASVTGEILGHERGDKIVVFKMKRRKGYRRKAGHRQELTRVRITDVTG